MFKKIVKYRYILSCVVLIAAGCQSVEEKELTLDDLAPSSKKYIEGQIDTTKLQLQYSDYDSLSSFSRRFIDSMNYEVDEVHKLDVRLFPDRFKSVNHEKWYVKNGADSVILAYWDYKDSILSENTFFNWLDCFGAECRSIPLGSTTPFSKRGTLILVQDKRITWMEADNKINLKYILNVLDEQQLDQLSYRYMAIQQPKRKTAWKKRNVAGKLLDFQD